VFATPNTKQKAYLQLHVAVLLFGITAILGKIITLDEIALVWNRLWIAVLGLLFIPGAYRGLLKIERKNFLRFVGIGVIVALHWITFYGSIKLGNSASVTLACLATSSLFTAILEPLITKSKFQIIELFLGLLVIAGIMFLTGVGEAYYMAIVVGLISAILASTFSALNKKYIGHQNSISVSIIELASGFVFISLCFPLVEQFIPQNSWIPQQQDWVYLIILGVLCTSVAYVLALNALKQLSAFIATLSVNLEPVYGILLAIWLLKENQDLNQDFYIGTGIILTAVLLHPILIKLTNRKKNI
jgi:drug/metabolite transporter (DMT)-like permease